MTFSPTHMMKARTVADSADVDYCEIPSPPVIRRRCKGSDCITTLRQSNHGDLCSVCERKYQASRHRDEYRGFEQEQERGA
jgi:protein-tyrosine-phosphatase